MELMANYWERSLMTGPRLPSFVLKPGLVSSTKVIIRLLLHFSRYSFV